MVTMSQGVDIAPQQMDCQRLLSRLQVPIFGVLAFCGDYNLTFTQLDMRGVHIHSPMLAAREFSVPWRLALLVFGSSIRVGVQGARILQNNAGSAIAVAHDARAEVTAGSVVVNNHAGEPCLGTVLVIRKAGDASKHMLVLVHGQCSLHLRGVSALQLQKAT